MGDQNGATERPEITKELLEEAVRAEKGTDNVEVLDFTTKAGSNKGDNYLSIITAVEVRARVKGQVETCHYIVKEKPEDPARKKFLELSDMFGKEMKVYAHIIPALEDVQKEFKPKNLVKVEAPKMYSSLKQTQFLVFENLAQQGYKMGNKYTGLDQNHCRIVMTELAKFHALSYALKMTTKRPLEEQYPYLQDCMFSGDGEAVFSPYFESSYDLAIKVVEDSDAAMAKKMKTLLGDVYQRCKKIRYNTEGLEVICHGDCWVNNILFKYDNSRPVAAKLLDFQISREASPTLDLLYFFFGSTTMELRRAHLNDLLKHYHHTFTDTINSLGIKWPEFTFERLRDKYDKDRLIGFFFGCMVLPFMMARPEESFSMEDVPDAEVSELSGGFTKQMEESLEKMKGNHHFVDRLKGIVLDVEEAGWI